MVQKKVYTDNTVLFANTHRIIATSSVPLFSFKNIGIDEEGGIVGGYIYNKANYVAHLLKTIDEIIDGRPVRSIPFRYVTDAAPVFNYRSLLQRNLNPQLCPPETVFYNMPPTFGEEYKYVGIGFAVFLVLLLLTIQYGRLRVLHRIKNAQQRELKANARYQELINNMPILYMYEALIKNEEGRIIDTRYLDVNRYFEDKFVRRDQIVGKLGSVQFPESMPEFLHFMNIALWEKRSVTFPYYYKNIDIFYDVVV